MNKKIKHIDSSLYRQLASEIEEQIEEGPGVAEIEVDDLFFEITCRIIKIYTESWDDYDQYGNRHIILCERGKQVDIETIRVFENEDEIDCDLSISKLESEFEK